MKRKATKKGVILGVYVLTNAPKKRVMDEAVQAVEREIPIALSPFYDVEIVTVTVAEAAEGGDKTCVEHRRPARKRSARKRP